MIDSFDEPARSATFELKERGSRFIADARRVRDEAAAREAIDAIRATYHDARHHCWAFRIGYSDPLERWNDDGEPNGSAGQPIARKIEATGLTHALVVVTRYFGGTKLGVGGLMRAYGGAAAEALEGVGRVTRIVRRKVAVRFDYADTSPAMHTIGRFDVEIGETAYGDDTRMTLAIRLRDVDAFRSAFVEALAGRGVIEPVTAT